MVVDSCCSSSGVPAPAAAASKDAASRGGWKHTVVTELRRKCSPGSSSLNKAAAGDEPEAPPLPIPKRLDSTSSTASSATQPLAPASRPRPPCRADFAWVRVIGAGSFGRVSLARHIESGRLVAVKTLNKVAIIRENQVQHVVDERAMLARVAGYAFIINLLTSFQDTDNLYLVMDFVAGGEFFTHLRDHGRLQEEHARFYVAQVVLALEHLHSKGIAYRDLKPENLLIASDGYARLTDLGFAKVVKGRTFTMCGTPDYLAPEVITGKGHTTAVDWWSLGCVIYEMLHGFPPFYTGNPQETYKKILARDLAFPAHMGPWARDLINKLLNPDPVLRLGGGVEGVQAVKDHDWFKNLEWNYVAAKAYMPPYTPPLKTPDDTSCFDKYDHLPPLESAAGLTPMQQDWFRSFSVPA